MRVAWLILLFFAFSAITISAQDAEPIVDNWCDDNGIWDDGRCGEGSLNEQLWHWTCGWYMAQVDNGVYTIDELRVNVPECNSLYPSLIEQASISGSNDFSFPPSSGCFIINGSGGYIDSDCDGLWDSWELTRFRYLGQSATDDPDMDMCDNLCEQNSGTRPDNDTDMDGLFDVSETDFFMTDPLNQDTDADTVIDGVDNCPTTFGTVINNGCL